MEYTIALETNAERRVMSNNSAGRKVLASGQGFHAVSSWWKVRELGKHEAIMKGGRTDFSNNPLPR